MISSKPRRHGMPRWNLSYFQKIWKVQVWLQCLYALEGRFLTVDCIICGWLDNHRWFITYIEEHQVNFEKKKFTTYASRIMGSKYIYVADFLKRFHMKDFKETKFPSNCITSLHMSIFHSFSQILSLRSYFSISNLCFMWRLTEFLTVHFLGVGFPMIFSPFP